MIDLKIDPLTEMLGVIAASNPNTPKIDLTQLDIVSIKPSTGDYNTIIEVKPKVSTGLVGTLKFKYNRMDPNRLFSHFVALTKYPTVVLSKIKMVVIICRGTLIPNVITVMTPSTSSLTIIGVLTWHDMFLT